jgi:NADPH:quinone reductase-like Zn-dependent oxidoreductase
VNFRDVLNVLGACPADPGPPGADCAGIWAHAVRGSSSVGEAAFGFGPGSMGTVVCGNVLMMPPKAATVSFEAASTTPTVFVTVQAAFQQAPLTDAGNNILLHAAAGGVGLAGLQQSAPLGCTTMGTAGGTN